AEHERLVEQTRQLLVSLADIPAIRDVDPQDCPRILRRVLEGSQNYTNLAVFNRDGDLICGARPPDGPSQVGDRKYFQRVLATGRFAAVDYAIGRASGRPGLLAGVPIMDENGQVKAVLHAGIDLGWLTRFASEAELPEG